jgi:DNA-binding transcriptional MerR regulator
MQDDLLPTNEVAKLVRRTVATVNRWANEGKLIPAVEMPGETGARLYRRSDVQAFLAATEPTQAAS